MAKTANSKSARNTKMEVLITAAINTALGLSIGSPPLTVDMSSIHVGIELSKESEREIDETWVTGDPTPITTPDSAISNERYKITILWTQGKDTIINSAKDVYSDLLRPLHLQTTALPLQHIWSPAGGAVGDEEYSTDADETFLVKVPTPVGGATSKKVMLVYEIVTPPATVAVIA